MVVLVGELESAAYIVWTNYHSEGWSPRPVANWKEAWDAITGDQECIVTSAALVPMAPRPE